MLRSLARSFAKSLGYEVMGPPRAFAIHHTLHGLLRHQQINLVLDVGANEGQFGKELRASGYRGRIVSFEPLAEPYERLRRCAAADPDWAVAERTAVGSETGTITINLSQASTSSSILPMLPAHAEAAPQTVYVSKETVPIHRLDDLYRLAPDDRMLLKIDVQGYERQVLAGAPNLLAGCRAVILEMSLVPLYEGQTLALDLWQFMAQQGFEAWALETGFRHKDTWRMMQVDGLFIRRGDSQSV